MRGLTFFFLSNKKGGLGGLYVGVLYRCIECIYI